MNSRSQVTIFIIVAIILVAAVVAFYLMFGKTIITINQPSINDPEQYIGKCARDAASEAINIMLPQGGYLNPTNYKLYEDQKIAYLCYTTVFYQRCTAQEPMYIRHLQDEITNYSSPKIEACFSDMKYELERKGYSVEMGDMNVETKLSENIVNMEMTRKLTLSKQGETRKFESFSSSLNSPLYNLAVVAQEIASQEAKYCNFEYVGFMILYPEFNIYKKSVSEGLTASKIYLIQDRTTEKQLNMAIRSCAVPAGF